MSRLGSQGSSRGVSLHFRVNDIYTLLLALAALFLLIGVVLLAIEQFTFYGELFPSKEGGGKAKAKACAPAPPPVHGRRLAVGTTRGPVGAG